MHPSPQAGYLAPVAWWCRGGGGVPTTQAGARPRLGEGDACTVEEGMVDSEGVGGRV